MPQIRQLSLGDVGNGASDDFSLSCFDTRLTLSNRQVNLTEEGIDAALRVGNLPGSTMIATRVGTVSRVVAASPGYLQIRGVPLTPGDLVGHDCIGVEGFTGLGFWSLADGV
ncbi:hypothetical protein ASILVAE211_24440 [Acidisoma silvae]|uniref:LysR substrate-binding domain-containing protein n=1 Tax=Acidisoma silvae TaxID=2802396 RepID=A0A963YW77_9PROT|nr:hypothetical protein [Acidisoma silvae]